MYNRKQTFMSISTSIHREQTQNHEFESIFSINSSICTWVFLHNSLLLLCSSWIMIQMYNEGVYIPFPSCAQELSSLELNSIYFTLTILNVVYLLRTRAIRSRSITIYKCASLNCYINVRTTTSKVILQNSCWLVQIASASTLARLMWAMLLHHK
jgi:hypothetical protein